MPCARRPFSIYSDPPLIRCRRRVPFRRTDGAGGRFGIASSRSMSVAASAAVIMRPIASSGDPLRQRGVELVALDEMVVEPRHVDIGAEPRFKEMHASRTSTVRTSPWW
jgi:hypothetical protein